MPLCCIKSINCVLVKKKKTSKKGEPLVSEKTQTLTWSAALTLCAPGLPAGVGYEPSPPRSPLETSCSLPLTHLSDLRGRQTEEKQCNKRRQTYKTFLNHSFIHSGHSFTVQPCLLGLNYREQVLHMAYFHWPHLIKALKCKVLIPLIWCHMCIGKFTPFVSSLKTFSYRQLLGKLTSHLLSVWHVISLHPRAWYLVRKRCG